MTEWTSFLKGIKSSQVVTVKKENAYQTYSSFTKLQGQAEEWTGIFPDYMPTHTIHLLSAQRCFFSPKWAKEVKVKLNSLQAVLLGKNIWSLYRNWLSHEN